MLDLRIYSINRFGRRTCQMNVAIGVMLMMWIAVAGGRTAWGVTAQRIGLPKFHLISGNSPIAEPYPAVHGGGFSGPPVKSSPDPLVAYRWPRPDASDGLQTYVLRPVSVSTRTPKSFSGLQSVTSGNCNITVRGTGAFRGLWNGKCSVDRV